MRKQQGKNLGFVAWVRATMPPNDAQKALTAFEALSSAARESNPARVRATLKGAETTLGKRLSKRTAAVYASRFRTAFDRWYMTAGKDWERVQINENKLDVVDPIDVDTREAEHRASMRGLGHAVEDRDVTNTLVDSRKAIAPVEETKPTVGDVLLQAAQLLDESNRWPALQPYLVPFVANLIRKLRG